MQPWCGSGPALLVAILALATPGARGEEPEEPTPFESSLVETAGVSLMLFDVEVTDESGEPRPGLGSEDFAVWLDGRSWPVYSVDDLCPCAVEHGGPETAVSPETPSAPAAQPDPVSYVLYFDFSQLQMDGRVNAFAASRTWIREEMRDEDRVGLVGYTSSYGLREITPITDERERLLSALAEAEEDVTLVDTFPQLFWDRVRECEACCLTCDTGPCVMCCPDCVTYPRDEYQHGRRALKALQRFLSRLEGLPGRKIVVFFNQNGMLYPGRFYPVDETRIGDHISMVDQVAAEATTSRAAIYAAYSGDLTAYRIPEYPGFETPPAFADEIGDFAVNFGANLADFTGGSYNRSVSALPDLMREAGRGCACIYRLAIEPPKGDQWKIYRAKVKVAGSRLPYLYRVQYLTAMDRWWRRATDVLLNPERATDLPLSASVFPTRMTTKGWTVQVQVLIDVDSLLALPGGGQPDRGVGGGRAAPAGRRPQPPRDARCLDTAA